jgi:hypothetical protein
VRIRNPFPPAWIACRIRKAVDWGQLYTELSRADATDEAWFLNEDLPLPLPDPLARTATVKSWNENSAIVEHDGACILILRQAVYPGWVYRIDDGPEQPVLKVDGGLQGVLLTGAGMSRIELNYRPNGLSTALVVTLAAIGTAIATCCAAGLKAASIR